MSHNGRRILYHPQYVRGFANALREARNDLHDMHFKHLCELADLRCELDECRAALNELRAATLARQHAEAELASLHRERAIARARAAERDPAVPLQ
jgi:hypothetical protein